MIAMMNAKRWTTFEYMYDAAPLGVIQMVVGRAVQG
jgi:hypothetical protein